VFLGDSRRPTSPPLGRRVPPPPAAASAAGGWGSPGRRRVYSVGLAWVLAGGVLEREARPERLLLVGGPCSGGLVLRSCAADLLPCTCSGLHGADGRVLPSPESVGRRIRDLRIGIQAGCVAGRWRGRHWVEALWGRGRRLPSRRGTVPYPRPEGIDCGGAPAYVWFVVFVNGVAEGLLCNIVYVSGPICKIPVII
jgi:hypothetical protein